MDFEYQSQIGQDRIVLKYLKNKINGYFVDIGCGYPIHINNTYILERKFGWSGVSIDLFEYQEPDGRSWYDCRKTPLILEDALKIEYKTIFLEKNLPKEIDFLSMDLEPPILTLECLSKIPFDDYNFKIITFEVDKYRDGYEERIEKSRKYLTSKGYSLIGSLCNGQDDVYLNNEILYLKDEIPFHDDKIIWTLV